jgi:hypothetical protein
MNNLINDELEPSKDGGTLIDFSNKQSYSELDEILGTYKEDPMVVDNVATNTAQSTTPVNDGKKGRGRPRKDGTANTVKNPHDATISGDLINGALFLMLIDLIMPMLIAFMNNKTSKKKIDASDLQMTEKQKKDLEPIANSVTKMLNINAHPVTALVIALAGIYGINLVALKQSQK